MRCIIVITSSLHKNGDKVLLDQFACGLYFIISISMLAIAMNIYRLIGIL